MADETGQQLEEDNKRKSVATNNDNDEPTHPWVDPAEHQFIQEHSTDEGDLSKIEAIVAKRNAWLKAQKVVDLVAYQSGLDQERMSQIVEGAAMVWNPLPNEMKNTLIEGIDSAAIGVAMVPVANSIAAELIKRLHPEYSIQSQFNAPDSQATAPDPTKNEYDFIINTTSRIDAIRSMSPISTVEQAFDCLSRADSVGLKEYIGFLNDPAKFIELLDQAVEKIMDNSEKAPQVKRIILTKFLAATDYIQNIKGNGFTQGVIDSQLGLGTIKFDEASKVLEAQLAIIGVADTEPIFRREDRDKQKTIDTGVIKIVYTDYLGSKGEINQRKLAEARRIIDDRINALTIEIAPFNAIQRRIEEQNNQENTYDTDIANIKIQIDALKQATVAPNEVVWKLLRLIRKAPEHTRASRDAKIAELQSQINYYNSKLLEAREVGDPKYTETGRKLKLLRGLKQLKLDLNNFTQLPRLSSG